MRRNQLLIVLTLCFGLFIAGCLSRSRTRGDDDDDAASGDDCAAADSAMQSCLAAADFPTEEVDLYCPATTQAPGSPGYMGPGTDWTCIVSAWTYECDAEGPTIGFTESSQCFIDDGAAGDDDDAATDDDDAATDDDDAATDDDDATSPPGGTGLGLLPCGVDTYYDMIELWGVSGTILVSVDTIDDTTAFDLALVILDGPDPASNKALAAGDDDFECSFTPPDYSCPAATADVGPGQAYVMIYNGSDSCRSSIGGYAVTVLENGAATNDYSLVSDDILLPPLPETE